MSKIKVSTGLVSSESNEGKSVLHLSLELADGHFSSLSSHGLLSVCMSMS